MIQQTDLHPEEHPLVAGLELEDKDPARGASRHCLELHVVREDNQIILCMALKITFDLTERLIQLLGKSN